MKSRIYEVPHLSASLVHCLILAGLSFETTAFAQEIEEGEPIFELSPFTIDASEDTGYTAVSTLAGTRIRTDLKDLGAAISVVTSEFMEDTGATDAATLLSYTTNTEVGGFQGNFSGGEPGGTSRILQTEERTNPQFNQRVRGLGSADLTRGYFLTDIPFDSYNTNRVDVSRGPNSLLFGIGSPGGVINNTTKQAIHNGNFNEARFRFDNYGSMRTEFDFNRSIVDGRVALRISTLYDELKYKQDPAWNTDKRIYGALDILLSENENSDILDTTTLRMNVESGNSSGSPVEVIPPTIAYHGWFEPISANIEQYSGTAPPPNVVSPSEGGTWQFQETYNPFEKSSESQINTNVHPFTFQQFGIVYNDANDSIPDLGTGDGLQGFTGLFPWRSNRDTLESTGYAGTPGAIAAFGPDASGDTPVNSMTWYTQNSPYADPYALGFTVPTLQNREVFDYRNKVYGGGLDFVERKFSAKNISLEQNFFNNRMGIEVAYDEQHYETHQDFLFSGGGSPSSSGPYDIYVDIAEYMLDGQPNPNLGRANSRVRLPSIRFNEVDRETFRATAFGEMDLTENDGWLRHLGRHRFTGLFNDYTRNTHNILWREGFSSRGYPIRGYARNHGFNGPGRWANVVVYTSDSLLGVDSMDDIRLDQIQIPRHEPGGEYTVFMADLLSDDPARKVVKNDIYIDPFMWSESVGRTKIEANAFAWQSYLFNEHIVGLFGYREDDTESFARASESEVGLENRLEDGGWNPNFAQLSKNPSLVESGDTTTWSIVGRYPESILGELPWGMDLQVHLAESENFNPIGLRNDALGRAIGQPTGTTEEYGFLVSFAENKFSIKVNWFETSLNDVNAGPSVNIASEAYTLVRLYREDELLGVPFNEGGHLDTVQGDPASFPIKDYTTFYDQIQGAVPPILRDIVVPREEDTNGDGIWDRIDWDNIPALRSTQDRVAEGFEVEMTVNPTPGWRILANVSKQETVNSNTAAIMADVVEEYNNNLQAVRLGELRRLDVNRTTQIRSINSIWLTNGVGSVRSAKALDNTVSNEQREWRFTAVTNYEFLEGGLRGFSVGGAARWEDEAATGYVFALEPESGVPVPDVDRPFFDDGLFSGDIWVSYSRKIWDGKVDWKAQLNVRNAFGDNEDMPVKTNPDGRVAVIRIPNPRTIYLSNTFRF